MLKDEEIKARSELAKKLKASIETLGEGGKAKVAAACDASPQAVTGWINEGKINFFNLCTVAKMTKRSLDYFAPTQPYKNYNSGNYEINETTDNLLSYKTEDEKTALTIMNTLLPSQKLSWINQGKLLMEDANQLRKEQQHIENKCGK